MTSAAVAAATTPLPRPKAISAPVENDVSNRVLVVKRPRDCSGYEAFMWREAHDRLANAEKRGQATNLPGWMMDPVPIVWCSAPGHRNLVLATPAANLELQFRFAPGTEAAKVYEELVSKPLSAIVTIDRGTLYFLGVRLFNRG